MFIGIGTAGKQAGGGGESRTFCDTGRICMFAAAAGRLTASPCPVMPVLPAAPAAAHQCAMVRTLLVFCLLMGGFAAAQTAAQPVNLTSLQPEAESLQDAVDLDFVRAFRDGETSFAALGEARNIAVNQFASRLFVTGENAVTVAGVARNAGTLRQLNLYRDEDVDGLNGASALALSPDDSLLFITAATDNALSVWRVDAVADTLEQTDLHKDGEEDLDGLDGASDLVLSSDGNRVFVVSERDDALSVWQVDTGASTPTITQSALYRNDSDDIDGLDGASALALSPDGRLLFVAAAIDDALSVWRVNASSGTLELAETYKNGAPGIDGLDGASDLAVSPGGLLLFAASETGDALSAWQVNVADGTLEQTDLHRDGSGGIDGLDGVSDITLNSDGSQLFVTARTDDALSVWNVNFADGTLLQTGLYRDGSGDIDGLDGAFAVALSRNDSLLFVTGNDDDTISFWRTAPISAVLSSEALMIRAQVGSAAPMTVTLVITAMQGEQMIAREATLSTGDMSAAAVFQAGALGPGRWTFEVTSIRPPGVLNAESLRAVRARVLVERVPPRLSSLQPEAARGLQVQAALYQDGVSGIEGLDGAAGIAVSADGSLLFVAAQADDALSVWEVNAKAGTLTQTAVYRDDSRGGNFNALASPADLALSPDGSLLFVAAQADDALSVLQVNTLDGTLEELNVYSRSSGGNLAFLNSPMSIALSPDGGLLFVTANLSNALHVFRVNGPAGTLDQLNVYRDGISGIDGLNSARGIAISPDGSLLFVTGQGDDALSVWRVNAAQGSLEQTQLIDGNSGDLAINTDGSLLFVTSTIDNALSVWQVDASTLTPTLTRSALYRDNSVGGNFDGLQHPIAVTLSPDDSLLFVLGFLDNILSAWQVDAEAGTLMQSALYRDDSRGGNFNGLGLPNDLALSPDGSLLFVTSLGDDALSVWHIIPRVLSVEEIMLRVRISEALQQDVTLVIAARQNEQMIAREATLLAGETSAAAVFEAGALGTTGRWTFEVTETRPPDVVLEGLEAARTEVLVVQSQLVTLELSAPQTQLMRGAMFTVTVAATPAPMTELNVQVSLTGEGVMEVMQTATLTMENPSQALTFTVPADAPETLQLATQTTVEDVLLAAVTEATATVTAVPIQPLDFLVPQGTVTVDDLVFALRHFIICPDGCNDEATVRGLTANLPPLHAGMDAAAIANINTDIDLTIATVTEDNADAPGIVALLQYLSEIPGEILPPANEGARQEALGLEPAQ